MANTTAAVRPEVARISLRDNWWIILPIAALIVALQSGQMRFLLYVHLFAGILWTGTDLFMGFLVGPILRKVDIAARRAVILRLMPRMLFYMLTVSTLTITSGYYLAQWRGFFSLPYPQAYWVVAAGILAGIMLVQGLGILLPTNLMVFFEMRKERPNGAKVQRLMTLYVRVVASQGVAQLTMIALMIVFRFGP